MFTAEQSPSPGKGVRYMSDAVPEFHGLVQVYCELLKIVKTEKVLTSLHYDASQHRLIEETTTRIIYTQENVNKLRQTVKHILQILSREQKLRLRRGLWRKGIVLKTLFK